MQQIHKAKKKSNDYPTKGKKKTYPTFSYSDTHIKRNRLFMILEFNKKKKVYDPLAENHHVNCVIHNISVHKEFSFT